MILRKSCIHPGLIAFVMVCFLLRQSHGILQLQVDITKAVVCSEQAKVGDKVKQLPHGQSKFIPPMSFRVKECNTTLNSTIKICENGKTAPIAGQPFTKLSK